jgi:hypothetical protein
VPVGGGGDIRGDPAGRRQWGRVSRANVYHGQLATARV